MTAAFIQLAPDGAGKRTATDAITENGVEVHRQRVLVDSTTPVSRSGMITAGGTAQVLAPANAARRGWAVQNLSPGDLWINEFGGTAGAGQPSMLLSPGDFYESPASGVSTGAISIFGANTAQAFFAKEW